MKKVQLFLTALLFFAFTCSSFGQLYIDANNNVAVGDDSISTDAKMKVVNTTELSALKIENTKDTTADVKGIDVIVNNIGTGKKYGVYNFVAQNASSSENIYGNFSEIQAYGTGTSYGYYSITNFGNAEKFGFYSSVTQPATSTSNSYGYRAAVSPYGSGIAYGIDVGITEHGSGSKYGIRSDVRQTSTSSSLVYGLNSYLVQNGSGQSYGISNTIQANTSAYTYGEYISINGSGNGQRIGLYSTINGGSGRAGDFIGDIYMNGQIVLTSDENLKENINNLSGALGIISQLTPKTYNFKNLPHHGNDPNLVQYGFLAQELEGVLPDLVKEVLHLGRRVPNLEVDTPIGSGGSGEPELIQLEEDENVKAVNYIGLIPILTKAIQEQQVIIEDLRARLEAVERN